MKSAFSYFFVKWLGRPQLVVLIGLGFVSGLPNETISSTFTLWAADLNVSLDSIQWISLLTFFYSFKFLFAPFLDRFPLPFLGKRRGWMFCLQILIALCFLLLSLFNPKDSVTGWLLVSVCLAFFSSLYDVVYDAYRIESLDPSDHSIGTTLSVFGYRLTKVFTGLIIYFFLTLIGWSTIFIILALLMFALALVTLVFAKSDGNRSEKNSWRAVLIQPWNELVIRNKFWLLLLIILFYKLGDSLSKVFAQSYFKTVGLFETDTISLVNNILPLPFWFLGAILASMYYEKKGLFFCLFTFSVLQAIANIAYIGIIYFPNNVSVLVLVSFVENTTSGMFTAPFIVFIMSLCNQNSSATQFALLSALASLNGVFSGPLAHQLFSWVGKDWSIFFIACGLASVPVLIFLGLASSVFEEKTNRH